MLESERVGRLRSALAELVEAGSDKHLLAEAICRAAGKYLGLEGARVVERGGTGRCPLAPGYWLDTGHPGTEPEIECYAAAAGALLQQCIRSEATAADYSAVLARLDQLNRALDAAQRSEWIAGERSRIAQDLHDRVAQSLFGVGLKADWLLSYLDRDEHLRPDLERVKQLAAQGMRQVREAIFSLSSGLVDAAQFRSAVQGLLKELEVAGISGDLRTWGELQALPSEVTDALYQVLREALVNVRRHSGASAVLVSVRVRSNHVTVVVQDDGQGLPKGVLETYRDSGAHMGLRGMESRVARMGGTLALAPGDECGLVVTATVPLLGGKNRGGFNPGSDR